METKSNHHSSLRHSNALDMGFQHIDGDKYNLPKDFPQVATIDLSASGNEQIHIYRNALRQLADTLDNISFAF